jgi:hypothetical protein
MRTGYNTCLIPLLGLESSIVIAQIAFLRVGKLLPSASCFDVGLADKEMTYTSLTGAAQQKHSRRTSSAQFHSNGLLGLIDCARYATTLATLRSQLLAFVSSFRYFGGVYP